MGLGPASKAYPAKDVQRAGYIFATIAVSLLAIFLYLPESAGSSERGQDLSGEHEKVAPLLTAPGSREPERLPAGSKQERPKLKLPEVVVTGDRQYRVSAERRDLLLMDPMGGTKEMPADLGRVEIPGLEEIKDAPAADSITAKNHIFLLEAGGGSHRWGEGRIVAGYECESANCVLRADYSAQDHPPAFGIRPFDQKGSAEVFIGTNLVAGTKLSLGMLGKAESNRQPENRIQGWGDWLKRTHGRGKLRGEIKISDHSRVNLAASLGKSYQQGNTEGPVLRSSFGDVFLDYDQDIQGLTPTDLNLLIHYKITGQEANMDAFGHKWQEQEQLQNIIASFRFRPVSALHVDLGVRVDEFAGEENKSASEIIGQTSLVLPTGTVIYGVFDAGLDWKLVSEWSYEFPRPSVFWLPKPETVLAYYQAGVRQRFGENISGRMAWFRKEIKDVLTWLDGNQDGLFTLLNLSVARIEGLQVELETQYAQNLSQHFKYTYYSEASSGEALRLPNIPRHEGLLEMRLDLATISISLVYRYLGERFGDPGETTPSLGSAHLLGANGDFQILPLFNIFVSLQNILGYSWDEWLGYPGRNFDALAGVRLTF